MKNFKKILLCLFLLGSFSLVSSAQEDEPGMSDKRWVEWLEDCKITTHPNCLNPITVDL